MKQKPSSLHREHKGRGAGVEGWGLQRGKMFPQTCVSEVQDALFKKRRKTDLCF